MNKPDKTFPKEPAEPFSLAKWCAEQIAKAKGKPNGQHAPVSKHDGAAQEDAIE